MNKNNPRLFVGNLNYKTTEDDLKDFVAEAGVVAEEVTIINDRETGLSKGFGFVGLAIDENIEEAITRLNGMELGGRKLTVNKAQPRPQMGKSYNQGR